jgi:spore maturation protein CgeB
MLSEFLKRTPIRLWVDDSDELTADRGFSLQWKNIKVVVRTHVRSGLMSLFGKLNVSALQMMSNGTYMPSSFRKIAYEIVRSRDNPMVKNRETPNLIRKRLPKKTLRQIYPDRCQSPVVGDKYFDVLARSRVTFNKHTDKNRAVVGNLRMFEATGVGSCLLTDTGWNMKDLYEPDTEVVIYTSAEEAIEKVNYLLENENERASIASAGQKKTLSAHTIFHRCQLIDEVFQSKL